MSEKLDKELNKMVGGNLFYQKVARVQSELNAPKKLKNNFGGYSYRNVESIYEAVKPLLLREGLALFISDEIVESNDRIYVKATATLTDGYGEIQSVGYARETGMKKGMDDAQITGSCSSYARKYALGGLFLIDDNKDIDDPDYNKNGKEKEDNKKNDSKNEVKKEITEQEEVQGTKKAGKGKLEPADNDLADKAVVDKMIAEFAKIGIEEPDLLGYFGIKREQIKQSDISVLRAYFVEKKAEYQAEQAKTA